MSRQAKKSEELNKAINDYMQDELKKMGFKSMDHADNVSKGRAFLKFYLRMIFSEFVEIDDEEIESAIVDKKNDLGIDFVHRTDNIIYIIQSKYQKQIDIKTELEHFIQIPDLIYKKEYTDRGNVELKKIIDEIMGIKNPSFKLYFVTKAKIEMERINFYETKKTNIEKDVEYKILSFSQLGEEYRRVQSLNDLPPEEVCINLGNEDVLALENIDAEYKTIVFTQKGTKIQNLYKEHKESLFNHNIRFWLGKSPVNNGMIETINNESEMFVYYNK